jgi:hypothetical protein
MNSTIAPLSRSLTIRRVGIALAAYKPDPAVFAEQLESIANQDFKNWHCLVTCDSSLEELRVDHRLAPFFSDNRFDFFENPIRLGHKANFDRAINLVAAIPDVDAIACSDQDDVWVPHKISRLVEALTGKPGGSLVHSDMRLFFSIPGESSRIGGALWAEEHRQVGNSGSHPMILRSIVNGAAMMFDAQLVRLSGGIPPEVSFHDQWYAALAASLGGVYPVRECLVNYRQHGKNVVGASRFAGRFSLPLAGRVRGVKALSRHFVSRWRETDTLSKCIRARVPGWNGLTLSRMAWFVIKYWSSDPVLARAAAGRLIGFCLNKVPGISGE